MTARIVPGTANRPLAGAVAAALGTEMVPCEVKRFPDGELWPIVGDVRGDDVYVVHPTGPAVNEHLVELLLLLDACRRGGADRVTAVVPYFGYARQDRRCRAGEAIGARVMADALTSMAIPDEAILVAPDLGAVKLAEHHAALPRRPVAREHRDFGHGRDALSVLLGGTSAS